MKLKRAIFSLIIIFAVVFTAVFGRYGIKNNGVDLSPKEYRGVITLWHVDSFEGGIGSRKQFLLSVASLYEKLNDGVLIMVITHTPESVETALKEGAVPDLISYGPGVPLPNLSELYTDKGFGGGKVGDKTYAVPWCRGGYCLIENPEYKVNKKRKDYEALYSVSRFSQAYTAALFCGVKFSYTGEKAPLDAYAEFTNGRTKYLLGTQRDINRLINRGMNFSATPFSEYNDLYQYVSASAVDPEKLVHARGFIDLLLSESVQKKLINLGMFSCFYELAYENSQMRDMQSAKFNYTVSAFSSESLIKELKEISKSKQQNDETIIKIKKLLTLS